MCVKYTFVHTYVSDTYTYVDTSLVCMYILFIVYAVNKLIIVLIDIKTLAS